MFKAGANLGANTPNRYGIVQNGAVVTETNLQQLNPYQNFFNPSLPEIYPRRGASSYSAFYASVTQRYGGGLTLLGYYSWSKTMDKVPETNAGSSGNFGSAPPQDPSNSYSEWTVASFDQPSRLIRVDKVLPSRPEWIGRTVPEQENKYPEARMFGMLPASGLYVRHVRDLRLKDLSFHATSTENRPTIIFDDVKYARISGLANTSVAGDQPIVKLVDSSDV